MKQVPFALIGCGRIGATSDERVRSWPIAGKWLPYSHAAAIQAASNATLVAVCDVDEQAARGAAQLHGVKSWYTDLERLLKEVKPQAVAIATRTPQRPAVIDACVAAGVKGIFCEKPLCNSLEEADRLARLMREKQVSFVYGTKRRFMPIYEEAKRRARSGEIGELKEISIRFGEGALLWTHPHSVDLACFFAGDSPLDWVQAELELPPHLRPSAGQPLVIDTDPKVRWGRLSFKSGIAATLLATPSQDVELWGTTGMIAIHSDGHSVVHRHRSAEVLDEGWLLDEHRTTPPVGLSGTRVAIERLSSELLGEGRAGYGPEMAYSNIEALLGLVESELVGGARISLPLVRRGLTVTGRTDDRYA
jgi:predicted dehydrogenase